MRRYGEKALSVVPHVLTDTEVKTHKGIRKYCKAGSEWVRGNICSECGAEFDLTAGTIRRMAQYDNKLIVCPNCRKKGKDDIAKALANLAKRKQEMRGKK